jgi:hypothetical protein
VGAVFDENTQPWHVHVVTGEPFDRIRQFRKHDEQHTANVVAMKKSTRGYIRRQVDIAIQIFEAMGIKRDDKVRRTDWVMRGFRQFDAPVFWFSPMTNI